MNNQGLTLSFVVCWQVIMIRNDVFKAKELRYLSLFAASYDDSAHAAPGLKGIMERASLVDGDMARLQVVYEPKTYRLQAQGGLSIQHLPKKVRNALLPDGAVDIDMVNSAPNILAQICHRHGIHCLQLDDFVRNYQERMRDLSQSTTKPKVVKNILLFGGEGVDIHDIPGWAALLKQEVAGCAEQLKRHYERQWNEAVQVDRENKEEREKKKRRKDREYTENIPGLFLSRLYFMHESQVLEAMDVEGRRCGFWLDDVTFMFDGMVVNPTGDIDLERLQQGILDSTGFEVTLMTKPLLPKMNVDITDIPKPPVIVGHHLQAAEVMALLLHGKALRSRGEVYVCRKGLWTSELQSVDEFLTYQTAITNILKQTVKANEEVVNMPFTANQREARCVANLVKSMLPERDDFAKELVLGSEGKVAFLNGFWEFEDEKDPETGLYGLFHVNEFFPTAVRIERDFPPRIAEDIAFIKTNILDPPFDGATEGIQEKFMASLSRALAGRIDKRTNLLTGGRDSSKSLTMQFVRNALQAYTCNADSSTFAIKSGSMNDNFRENAWVFDIEHARIAVASEGKQTSTKEVVFSGEALKKVQSAKEGIMARKLRQAQQEAYSLATYFLLMNDVPKFEPADAIERCHMFTFNNRFVTAAEKVENPYRAGYKIANPMVEQWVRDPRYTAALIWVLIESYDPKPVEANEEMKESIAQLMDDTGPNMYYNKLDITMDTNDKVLQSEMLKVLKVECPSIGHIRIRRELQTIMDEECRENHQPAFSVAVAAPMPGQKKRQRVYRGVVLKELNGNMVGNSDYSAFSEGFHP